jgi:hypothetical protein
MFFETLTFITFCATGFFLGDAEQKAGSPWRGERIYFTVIGAVLGFCAAVFVHQRVLWIQKYLPQFN